MTSESEDRWNRVRDIARLACVEKTANFTLNWRINPAKNWENVLEEHCSRLEKWLSISEITDTMSCRIERIEHKATANRKSITDIPQPPIEIKLPPPVFSHEENFVLSATSLNPVGAFKPDLNSPIEEWAVFLGHSSALYGLDVPEFSGKPNMVKHHVMNWVDQLKQLAASRPFSLDNRSPGDRKWAAGGGASELSHGTMAALHGLEPGGTCWLQSCRPRENRSSRWLGPSLGLWH